MAKHRVSASTAIAKSHEYLFHYKIKYSKQICTLFVNKLYKSIKNTGEKQHIDS